jgi:hypothetical protein
MTSSSTRRAACALGALALLPLGLTACPNNITQDLCCTDFRPGTDMAKVEFVGDAEVNGEFVAFAQAAGDISAVASGAVADVTGACMNIATDLGDDPKAAGDKTGKDALDFWCAEAVQRLNAVSVKGALSFQIAPPSCSVSVQAEASCQARCDVSGGCNIKATPPKCTGGTLQISCKGNCNVSASAPTIDCTGACTGQCSGTCEAGGGASVDCNGTCNGQCTAKAGGGTGIQGDGTCQGSCSGTCALKADAKVACTGTCSGKCDASCHASPGQASVKCSGSCDADYQPVSCEGGKLEGGCQVDANCQANCNASASARAECRPPRVDIVVTGSAQGLADVAATLSKNLPALLVVAQARGQAFLDLAKTVASGAADISASGKIDVKGTACLTAALSAAGEAGVEFGDALNQSGSVLASVGIAAP